MKTAVWKGLSTFCLRPIFVNWKYLRDTVVFTSSVGDTRTETISVFLIGVLEQN